MKKILLVFICFLKFFSYLYSLDLNSLKDYLGKDFSIVEKDLPNVMVINETYRYIYKDDESEYRIAFHLNNNTIFGITCTIIANCKYVAEDYFLKWKKEYKITPEGKLISDTLSEYSWIQSNNSFFIQINTDNFDNKYRVVLYILKT